MATNLRGGATPAGSGDAGRVALVLNEKAGAALAQAGFADSLPGLLAAAGLAAVDVPPGPLPARLANAVESGAGVVAVAGGDGTVACAASLLVGRPVALGIIPCGTMDLLARDLRLPVADPEAALRVIAAGRRRAIDVGMLEDQPFLCAAMLGVPAHLARHREQGRAAGGGIGGWLRFAFAAWRAVRDRRRLHVVAEIDGRRVRLRTPALTVTVNALDDRSGRTFGRTRLDGGELVIYVVRGGLLPAALRLLRGGVSHNPRVAVLRGRRIVLHSRRRALRVLLDGEERLLASPLRFTIKPAALQVIVP